jgi:hypothetical protein
MRVMVIVKATNDSEDGKMPTPELLEQMGAFNQQLKDAGIFVDADGLRPSAKGARVAFSRPESLSDQGSVSQRPRSRRRLLDLEGARSQRGDRVGQTLSQSHARTVGYRNPPAL